MVFRIGDPNLNLHLPLESWEGGFNPTYPTLAPKGGSRTSLDDATKRYLCDRTDLKKKKAGFHGPTGDGGRCVDDQGHTANIIIKQS